MGRKKINDGLTKWERWEINHPLEARASKLIKNYRKEDKKRNRGECTLTIKWVIDNIFSKPCAHCGKEGWDKIGCNRIDNSKPHTPDNVEPCCYECNIKLSAEEKSKKIVQIDESSNKIIRIWNSSMEARKNGFNTCYKVAKGVRNRNKGYLFKYL